MPARYVSGYLYTGDASDAASHAWVDVWLGPELGWQSIDVTHKRTAVRTYLTEIDELVRTTGMDYHRVKLHERYDDVLVRFLLNRTPKRASR